MLWTPYRENFDNLALSGPKLSGFKHSAKRFEKRPAGDRGRGERSRNVLITVRASKECLDNELSAAVLEKVHVIDLGAPRGLRPARALDASSAPRIPRGYTPNPRLYPGPSPSKRANKRRERARSSEAGGPRRRARTFRRPVPNSRLYRPAPARPPPPARLRAWPAPPPAPRALDTASRAALRLVRARSPLRLRLTLPAAMAAPARSASPDCSDGNDTSSAPSEFLAEFLSAIMRRQYAEALKYCQLILQYEPLNATARGFYPLLQLKVQQSTDNNNGEADARAETASSSEGTSPRRAGRSPAPQKARSSSGSRSASLSSLELDSSELRWPSGSPSPDLSPRRADLTDPSDSASSRWESGGERSERDDNGNDTAFTAGAAASADRANDNDGEHTAALATRLLDTLDKRNLKTPSEPSLQRLRAQFACSIK